MKKNDDAIEYFDFLVKTIGHEKAKDFLNIGCELQDWRKKAREYRDKLKQDQKNEIMAGLIEDQWKEIKNLTMNREMYYSLGNTPLEVLRECILGDHVTYPPPEVLMVIANQFGTYMANQGKISLEEAFFGDSRGRGVYAKRAASNEQRIGMYQRFKAYSESIKGKGKSQEQILLELASYAEEPTYTPFSEDTQPNPFYLLSAETENWIDNFLRGYRRWMEAS